ncbi:hypothetical protein [Glaciimonas immobilis]|uniref:Uncharacterized protein n=1 Tax=Glaciimonas immobilis TaxID=728004 RepID=A0A840RUU1_9BURK|nr:hypothetical protein [Glaciimonas immobilis]KAF3997485.1 hypothetical protein HAV38_12455 [Glaciimonas immobilis]MBB5200838.1 hypothetical protein [Glaciimonas immobilis]
MNDREIVTSALRWHSARNHRLLVGAQKRRADELDGFTGLHLQVQTSRQLTQAKRVEQAALRVLAKGCKEHRGHLEMVEDADLVIEGRFIEMSTPISDAAMQRFRGNAAEG